MTHPTLKAMVEAAEKATPGPWYCSKHENLRQWFIGSPNVAIAKVYASRAAADFIAIADPANILSLAQYVKGLEEKAAALLEEVTYLSGKYPLEPSLSGLEVAASDLRVALGGEP